ncbi:MAG: ATP-binding protein [Polyangiales bacterium]
MTSDGRERGAWYARAMESLVGVLQELSMARDVATMQGVVKRAARSLTGADGATFVLRDGDRCFYVDEDAIAPLWKGQRFPMSACVSGWVMNHREPVVIPDIYDDPRVPADAYRPTFVRSLAMVPIRTHAPLGAIGTYWATKRKVTDDELRVLGALADSTSVAMENVEVYADLERRVKERTAQLEAANRELEAFSYSVSHDLRAPLRRIDAFSKVLEEEHADALGDEGRDRVQRVRASAEHMARLIDDLLELSRTTRVPLRRRVVDITAMAREVVEGLRAASPERAVEVAIEEGIAAEADPGLLRAALENLLSNAWKFTSKREGARIEVGTESRDGRAGVFVRDNGAGFDPSRAGRLFVAFQRLHGQEVYPGTGVGLATVQRIVQKHGGEVRAEGAVDRGATFWFTLTPAAGA